ncbi:MAG TPA: alpha-amylase family protein [Mycobacteriales bacterium]|nr:alpha-amylase family protein [Mycobacteriales bacterium]
MSERWYKEAVIYCVEVDTFHDSDGDGHGDLRGLISRLDYLAWLGVTCLWLNPIHPTPNRDDGYDVADYYAVDSRLGSLGDFADLAAEARERGIRLILDLVVNHTSDQHPWFQSARSDPRSPYRDWYVWSDKEPADRKQGIVFPGEQSETWTYDDTARAWYFHRFYDFQPDLNWANRAVREEIKKVMGFWLQLGASGFRIDAAPFVLDMVTPDDDDPPQDFGILDDWRQDVSWRKGDAVLLCEANVDPDKLGDYVASTPGGPNDRAHMLFAFLLNARLWLALARQQAEPVTEALRGQPALPAMAQWATFLRNHDELDLSRLTKDQQTEVFRAFAPKPDMQLYDRGVRRRLAPMLKGDRQRMELAYSLQFAMPGTPVLRYGEEIGMGEDLALKGRDAIRTPMQWDGTAGVGFSAADPKTFVRPAQVAGKYGARRTNVESQMTDGGSLLRWFQQLLATLRMCPEIGVGTCTVVDVPLPASVLAHRFDAPEGAILLLHNLGPAAVTLDLSTSGRLARAPVEVFANTQYAAVTKRLSGIELSGYGYRWLRLRDR